MNHGRSSVMFWALLVKMNCSKFFHQFSISNMCKLGPGINRFCCVWFPFKNWNIKLEISILNAFFESPYRERSVFIYIKSISNIPLSAILWNTSKGHYSNKMTRIKEKLTQKRISVSIFKEGLSWCFEMFDSKSDFECDKICLENVIKWIMLEEPH